MLTTDVLIRKALSAGALLFGLIAPAFGQLPAVDSEQIIQRVSKQPRPRTFPDTAETRVILESLRTGERADAYAGLRAQVRRDGLRSESAALGKLISPDEGVSYNVQKQKVEFEGRQLQAAALIWLVSRDPDARLEARRRALGLTTLDPRGATGVGPAMLNARHTMWALALALDWMGSEFSADERRTLVQAIEARMTDFVAHMTTGKSALTRWPWDSHAHESLGAVVETALILLGDSDKAAGWVNSTLPLYVSTTLVWAGADGGFANGTAYAGWDVGEYSLRHWDAIRRMAGVDITQKPWARNFGRYLLYFLPAGTPTGLFGDGAEDRMPEVWARYAQAYAARVPSPLNRWYASQWRGADETALELLTAPVVKAGTPADQPRDLPPAAAFQSIGWVAMHSNLADPGRTSVYFKSSPFGSINHSHADQNSFVINVGQVPLLIDSGYYDSYRSEHQVKWARRTVAHNAVTFDGGAGQKDSYDPQYAGGVTSFKTTATLDYAVGDATTAYAGEVTRAARAVLYFRPDVVVVLDGLESAKPRNWEWNLHTRKRFVDVAADEIVATDGAVRACIQTAASAPLRQSLAEGFPAQPSRTKNGERPDQAHFQAITTAPTARIAGAQVIRIGCSQPRPEVVFDPEGAITVQFRGTRARFDPATLTISTTGS